MSEWPLSWQEIHNKNMVKTVSRQGFSIFVRKVPSSFGWCFPPNLDAEDCSGLGVKGGLNSIS